ncbi:TPA: DUF3313 domain-containing protein [Klebsiella quasipneumoniae subsp. similipneumoniae]|nr:DUF3313 domain-containing protein [Klebsiella quasipneumoniae subsp. similipneumoniae]
MKPSISVLIFAVTIIAMTACSTTSQSGRHTALGQENLNGSGFLNDVYPLMKDGKDGEALRLYRNPKYFSPESFTRFTKVQLDPVKLYVGPRSKLKDIPQDQAQAIAQSFYNQLYEQFGKDYQMAQTSGPDTLRISIAIVDAEASNTLLKAASYVPLGFPGAKAVAIQATTQMTGQPLSTGQVTIEGKMYNSQTGEIVAAAIDRRTGSRRPIIGLFEEDTYDEWSDVTAAGKFWAEKMRYRLCIRRSATNCINAAD